MIEIKEIKAIPTLMRWRAEVIEHVFGGTPGRRLLAANRNYYRQHIADNTHIAYVATVDGREAGCGALCLSDELPSPDNHSGRCAYLMNIYVRQPFRYHGVGHAIVAALLDKARALDCGKIYLETTADGRPVYKSLGFTDMHDMMKYHLCDDTETTD